MFARVVRIGTVALLAAAVGCASDPSRPEAPPSGSTFASRRGNFTCVVPYLIRPGAKMVETYEGDNTFVSFNDDVGNLLRIEAMPIPPEHPAEITGPRRVELLGVMLDKGLMPGEYLRASPDASVIDRRAVDTAAGQALFAVVSIPGGSTLARVNTDGSTTREDSTRGLLLFPAGGSVYVVSNQESPLALGMPAGQRPFAERADDLLRRLQESVAGMTFR